MIIYSTLIKENCIANKYTKWYLNIILNAKLRIQSKRITSARKEAKLLLGYVEAHHIWPKCLCIKPNQKLDFNNKVFLTFREHVIVHLLLAKMFNNKNNQIKMKHACGAFTSHRNDSQRKEMKNINSRTLTLLKIENAKSLSEIHRGKHRSAKWIINMSKPKASTINFQGPKSKEHAANIGKSRIGRRFVINFETGKQMYVYPDNIPDGFILANDEIAIKLSQQRRNLSENTTIDSRNKQCPHCFKTGRLNMSRYHFNNCKYAK